MFLWVGVHRHRPARLILTCFAVGIVATAYVQPPVPDFVRGSAVVEWPTADGFGGTHFSPLDDITPRNVAHLEVAWTYRTGDVSPLGDGLAGSAFEATPIVVDGLLYVATPYSRAVALDPETGEEVWTFDPGLDRSSEHQSMVTSRGLSHWRDPLAPEGSACASRIFLPVFDARLYALDAKTGRPCRDFASGSGLDLGEGVARIDGRRHRYKLTAPPTPVGDVVVVGSSIFDGYEADTPSGVVRAFDARTGELRWAWEPLAGLGAVDERGQWVPAGGANAWATITADAARDLLFVPTGSPSPDHFGGLRGGDDTYANSLVALRASTGEVVWHFQIVHHDLWDYDLPSPPALVTLERDGRSIAAVVQSTKMGFVFVFDRETGEPLFPVVERPVPGRGVRGERLSPTQPVPVLPRPLAPQRLDPADAWGLTPFDRAVCRERISSMRSEGIFTPPSFEGSVTYPGFIGGMEWGGVAFDPRSHLLIANTNRLAMATTLIPREVADTVSAAPAGAKYSVSPQHGTPFAVRREALLSPLGVPCTPPPWGMLHAVDLRTGEVAWEVPLGTISDLARVPTPGGWGSPNLGGPLVSGGLVFIGASMDRRLRAFDLATGEVAWSAKLPASAQATPMTYRARASGRQFVVVAAGGHSGLSSRLGDHLIAFALPEGRASQGSR